MDDHEAKSVASADKAADASGSAPKRSTAGGAADASKQDPMPKTKSALMAAMHGMMMKKDKKHEAILIQVNVKCSITISPCPEISDEVISLLRAPGPVYSRHVRHGYEQCEDGIQCMQRYYFETKFERFRITVIFRKEKRGKQEIDIITYIYRFFLPLNTSYCCTLLELNHNRGIFNRNS